MLLALIAALPFAGALLTAGAARRAAWAAGGATAAGLVLVALQAPAVLGGQVLHWRVEWLPALGMNLNLMLDGLGLLFAGLILGIGLLIVIYARFYLSPPTGRFFAFLMLFQGAMLGIVLADNILILLIFWEMTSLASFLLIGYPRHSPNARQGARMALAVTGGGGLAMIAGMLMLGDIAGSYDLSVILTRGEAIRASDAYLPALLLILAGAFTKSAQFPFHFWLPHAMAAPTPVSAYLHSATMVKAGLFLMARLWPAMAGTEAWFLILTTAGLATMVIGAKIAFFQHDLKGLLAYSTVSHLGLITLLLGLGTEAGAVAAVFHILNHASFKAALFMAAGIVDHEAGTRDIRRLGGLRAAMPLTFALSALAALAMAGIPPLNGFLSKEMLLEEAAHTLWWGSPWLLGLLVTLGAGLSVAYSLRLVAGVFLGPPGELHHPHDPGPGLWGPPAVLVALAVLIGLFPMAVAGGLVQAVAGAVTGAAPVVKITHWHGPTAALFMSVAALGLGLILLGLAAPLTRLWQDIPRPDAKRMFEGAMEPFAAAAGRLTHALHDGSLPRYLAVAVLAILAAGTAAFLSAPHAPGTRALTDVPPVVAVGWLLLASATVLLTLLHRQRLLALILMGIVGLMVSVGFAWLSAPDLALTQISVEVVTVVLLLMALNFLPATTPAETRPAARLTHAAIAGAAGVGTAALAWALMTRDFAFPTISAFHLENSYTGGGGDNVVNVILVDFRGYDTFGEITVLGIAGVVIFALTQALLRGRLPARPAREGEAHPLLMQVVSRLMLPLALTVGVYILLRGHNDPGGGFIAGLIVAIAMVMQYMGSGFGWTEERARIDWHHAVGSGVLVAALCGAGAWIWGAPFLTSAFGYLHLPWIGPVEWATAAIFDLGVFLCVVGAVMLALQSLARLGRN